MKAGHNGSETRSEKRTLQEIKPNLRYGKVLESGKVLKKNRNYLKRVYLDQKMNQSHLLTNDSLLKKIHEIKLRIEYCRDSNWFF